MRDAIVMKNEQIGELTKDYPVPEDLLDVIIAHSPEGLNRGEKIMYMIDESFKHGFMTGLYIFNESLKASFDEIEKDSDE